MAELDFSFLVGDKAGFEDLNMDVMSLPFISILQDLSPQVKKKSDSYVEGAEPGMFYNTGTKEVFSSLSVTVVKFEHTFLRWRPNRGGYFGQFSPEEVLKMRQTGSIFEDSDGSLTDINGNKYQETYTYYLVIWGADGTPSLALFSCSSSMLKEARRWNRDLSTRRLPNGQPALPYFSVYRLNIKELSNDKGSWYGFEFSWSAFVSPDMFEDVKAERAELPTRQVSYAVLEATNAEVPAIETTARY